MSTRYVKKGNKVILGMAKNGSQALKQLSFNNKDWVRVEGDIPEEILIDYRTTIYIPIRDEFDRAYSGLIQLLNDIIVDKKIAEKWSAKDIQHYLSNNIVLDNSYFPKISYKQIGTIHYFWNYIFLNKKWNGAKFKFFNLKYLSNRFCDYIKEDPKNIPLYNTAIKTRVKVEIMKYLPSKELLYKNYFHPHWKKPYQFMEKPIWKRLKTTEYWLDLEDKNLI
jgi:hypothetical protein